MQPSSQPTSLPTMQPTSQPSKQPTNQPSCQPSKQPTSQPSSLPTCQPSCQPSKQPTLQPTSVPTMQPTSQPSGQPSSQPSSQPSGQPSSQPSRQPSSQPSSQPSMQPSSQPSCQPSSLPSSQPSCQPSGQPSGQPSSVPTSQPSVQPSGQPSGQPSCQPSGQPSGQPSSVPTSQPSCQPSIQPSSVPSSQPSNQPSSSPTSSPTTSMPTKDDHTDKPTSYPTSMPSFETIHYEDNIVYQEYQKLIAQYQEVGSNILFNTFYYKNLQLGNYIGGECKHWQDYTTSSLNFPFDNLQITSFQASFMTYDFSGNPYPGYVWNPIKSNLTITCNDKSSVDLIVGALRSKVPGIYVETFCSNVTFVVTDCPDQGLVLQAYEYKYDLFWKSSQKDGGIIWPNHWQGPSICNTTSTPYYSCPGWKNNMIINTCQEDCKRQHVATYSILNMVYEEVDLFPFIAENMTIIPDRTSLLVYPNISKAGTVYCNAYKLKTANAISTFGVKLAGFSNFVTEASGGSVEVKIRNLSPSTAYQVYCYTEDFYSHLMHSFVMIDTKVIIETTCCPEIQFDLINGFYSNIKSGIEATKYQFMFLLDTLPTADTTVSIHLYSRASCNSTVDGIVPSAIASPTEFRFTSDLKSLLEASGTFIVKGTPGCFYITAHSVGEMYYSNATGFIDIASDLALPSDPTLSSAIFSNDGRKITVKFSDDTDRASTVISSQTFKCSLLFSFVSASYSSCLWIGLDQVIVTVGVLSNPDDSARRRLATSSLPVIGDSISVLPNTIKAACTDISSICYYSYGKSSSKVISGPRNPLKPQISLSTSSSIGACDDIIIDPTSSKGRAGRDWKYLQWIITAVGSVNVISANNVTSIENYLNMEYQTTNDLVAIPNSYIQPGIYTIQIKLTNFFDITSTMSIKVEVTTSFLTPRVSIAGPNSFDTYRAQVNTLFALSFVPTCGGEETSSMSQSMNYKWEVYEGLEYANYITSNSLDVRYFNIQPYLLNVMTTYTVRLTVSIGNLFSSPSSTAQVTIQVGQLGVVAGIKGGSPKTASVKEDIVVDASSSYDIDEGVPELSNLNYTWSCVEYSPVYGNPCLREFVTSTASIFTVPKNYLVLTESVEYLITVFVVNKYEQASSATTNLIIKTSEIPKVEINPVKLKYNPNQKVFLTAGIETVASAETYWSSLDFNEGLEELSNSPLHKIVNEGLSYYQIAILANTLTAGRKYTFIISSNYLSSIGNNANMPVAFSQVVLSMNEPPVNGAIYVTPTSGLAFNTTFNIKTKNWIDDVDDYPITYILGYYLLSVENLIVVKYADETTYMNTVLGQGIYSQGYNVTCLAQAFDVHGSLNSDSVFVNVVPPMSTAALNSAATSALESAFSNKNPSAVSQVVGAVIGSINTVNCSFVPQNCFAVNRFDCKDTPNTCGSCFHGLLGPAGDSNIPCVNASNVLKIGAECGGGITSVCATGNCLNDFCADVDKKCPNDCSEHGYCEFYNAQLNKVVPTCGVTNSACDAKCVCEESYFGASCNFDESQLDVMVVMRSMLCKSLYQTVFMQNPSKDVIISRANSIAGILLDLSQIDDEAMEACTKALVLTIEDNPSLLGDESTTTLCSTALSNVLERGSSLDPILLEDVGSAITILTSGMQSNLGVDEPMSVVSTKNARFGTQVVEPSSSTFVTPQSEMETLNNKPKTELTLDTDSEGSSTSNAIGVTILQYTNNPQGAVTDSESVGMQITEYGTNDGDGRRRRLQSSNVASLGIKVVLQNANIPNYYIDNVIMGNFSCHQSPNLIGYNETIYCPFDVNHTFYCPATSQEQHKRVHPRQYTYACPVRNLVAQCLMWDGIEFSPNPDCKVLEYNKQNTTCLCGGNGIGNYGLGGVSVYPSVPDRYGSYHIDDSINSHFTDIEFHRKIRERRKLAVQQTGELKIFTSAATLIGPKFLDNWALLSELTPVVLQYNMTIFYSSGGLFSLLLLGMFSLIIIDLSPPRKKYNPDDDEGDGSNSDSDDEEKAKKAKALADKKEVIKIKTFMNKILPLEFTGRYWIERFWSKLKIDHDWLCVLLPYNNERKVKSSRWISATGRILNILFISTIIAKYFHADDGKCEKFLIESTCLSVNTLDQLSTLCVWNSQEDSCWFHTPTYGFLESMILALVITIIVIPFDKLFNLAVFKVRDYFEYQTNKIVDKRKREEEMRIQNEHSDKQRLARLKYAKKKGKHVDVDALEAEKLDLKKDIYELATIQSLECTILRAARISKMKRDMDDCTVNEEVDILLNKTNDDYWRDSHLIKLKHTKWYHRLTGFLFACFHAPYLKYFDNDHGDIRKLTTIANYGKHFGMKGIIKSKIKQSRRRSERIVKEMTYIESDIDKEIYLLQQFVVNSLHGVKAVIAKRYMFYNYASLAPFTIVKKWFSRYICLILLPIYVSGCCLYIFLYGNRIGAHATNHWLLGVILTVIQDIFLLQPLKIWTKFVFITASCQKEIRTVHGLLREKAKLVMLRKKGMMNSATSLIQHFHPVCRAARSYPHLASARLLISLNDFDIPVDYLEQVDGVRYGNVIEQVINIFYLIGVFLLWILTRLPETLQDTLLEILTVGILSSIMGALWIIWVQEGQSVIVISGCVLVIVLVSVREYMALKEIDEAYVVYQPVYEEVIEECVNMSSSENDSDLDEEEMAAKLRRTLKLVPQRRLKDRQPLKYSLRNFFYSINPANYTMEELDLMNYGGRNDKKKDKRGKSRLKKKKKPKPVPNKEILNLTIVSPTKEKPKGKASKYLANKVDIEPMGEESHIEGKKLTDFLSFGGNNKKKRYIIEDQDYESKAGSDDDDDDAFDFDLTEEILNRRNIWSKATEEQEENADVSVLDPQGWLAGWLVASKEGDSD
jgi:hypothetical protein